MKVLTFIPALLSTLTMAGEGQPFDALSVSHPIDKTIKVTTKDSVDNLIKDYQWQNRVLLIFAPDVEHTNLLEQREYLSGMGAGLNARDLVVWQLVYQGAASVNNQVDANLTSQSFYDYFAVKDQEFTVILLGKDGTEKLRRTQPVTSQGLFSIIDAMPMRQREMRERGR